MGRWKEYEARTWKEFKARTCQCPTMKSDGELGMFLVDVAGILLSYGVAAAINCV